MFKWIHNLVSKPFWRRHSAKEEESISFLTPKTLELMRESEQDLDYSMRNVEAEIATTTDFLRRKIEQLDNRVEAVTSNVEEMIIVKTQNSRWISINKTAEDFFDIDPKACIGKTSSEVVALYPHLKDFATQIERIENDVLTTGEAKEIRCVVHIENKPMLLDLVVTATDTTTPTDRELVIVGNDVRKKFESVKHLLVDDRILNLSADPCVAYDQYGRIFVANDAYRHLFGLSKQLDLVKTLPLLKTVQEHKNLDSYVQKVIPIRENEETEPFYYILTLHRKEDKE